MVATTAFGQGGEPASKPARTVAVSPVDRAKAEASRRAFADQTTAEALATARRRHPDVFRLPAGKVIAPAAGAGLVRHLNDRAALVEVGGRRAVAASTLPLTTREAGGRRELVDTAFERTEGGFAGRNPLVETHVQGPLEDGVAFDGLHVRVVPLGGADEVAPRLVDGRLFWAGAAVDTDVVVVPTVTGFESFVQLRSEASPESLTMPVDLPKGGVLREDSDGFAVEVGDRTLLVVSRPTAVDAAGRQVALETRRTSDGIVIEARHRGRGYTYPLLVDPVVTAVPLDADPSGWTFSTDGLWVGETSAGTLWARAFTYRAGSGTWTFDAPGDSYVQRVDFHAPRLESFTCVLAGIYNRRLASWTSEHEECDFAWAATWTVPGATTPGPAAVLFTSGTNGLRVTGHTFEASFQGATIVYSDDVAPVADGVTTPAGWFGADQPLTVTGRDSGVGVKSIAASSPDSAWSASGINSCTGSSKATYCPSSWSISPSSAGMPQGENRVQTTVTDLVGRQATGTSVVRIDRSGPQLTVGGPLKDHEGGFLGEPLTLSASASDGSVPADGSTAERLKARSGLKSLELLVDGASVDASMPGMQRVEQPCPAGSCGLSRDLDFDPSSLTEGRHQISVRAIDQVGHATTSTPFEVRVDWTAPTLQVSGGLAAAEGTTIQPGDHDLAIATDDAAGVEEIEVLVDGVRRELVPQSGCSGDGCGLAHTYTHTSDAFTPGPHEVEVRAKDKAGKTNSKKIPIGGPQKLSDAAVAVGFEEYFPQRSIAAGAGSTASVNLGSGNFAWHHRPISLAGRGLSTNVDITYNSRSSELDLGHGYDEIGEGFSLAISSLTRVNEALDVRWVDKNNDKKNDVVTLTDADGTMLRFTRRMNGTTATDIFDPPPGVNVHLRRFNRTPQTVQQRRKVWAATLADGTTHFFDECGYQRSVEDRNGNALTYTYEEEDCHPQTQGRRAKLVSVTDAGGRSLRIFYESGSPGTSSRIDYILDFENRKLDFSYYANKKLERITEVVGTSEQRRFGFAYEQTGQTAADKDVISITDPLGRATQIAYSDDHGGEASLAPKFGLGERVISLTDRAAKTMTFGYVPGSPFLETRLTDRRSKLWRYRTDERFRLREMIDPLGTLQRFTWDSDNNLQQLDDAVGTVEQATTAMSWNANGELLAHTDAQGNRTEITYRDHNGVHESPSGIDAAGTFVSDLGTVTTPKGVKSATAGDFTTRFRYELVGDPLGTADRGNVRSVTDPEEYVTTFDYTSNGLLTREAAETNRGEFAVTTFENFDPSGLPQLITDARGNKSAEAGDGQWHVRYGVSGLTTRVTDPRGTAPTSPPSPTQPFTTQYTYDALHRQVSVRVPKLTEGGASEFIARSTTYDLNDNVRTATDGQQHTWTRTYTSMDQLETESSPAVAHDLSGGAAEPETTRLAYDAEQNLARTETPRGTRTATIDDFTTTFEYDDAGRQIVERRKSRGPVVDEIVTSFAYDRRGNVIGIADPNTNGTGGAPAVNATQDATRRGTFVYDLADRRIRSIEHLHDIADTRLTTVLDYDENDNLRAITDPRGVGHTATFEYDERDLTTAAIDPEGGRTEYEQRGDERLVRVTKPNGTATTSVPGDFETRMKYDPMGALLERTIPWANVRPNDGQTWTIIYARDEVGDPVTITDGRGRAFTNTFFDTGDLRTTTRPSWWLFDGTAIGERDPEAPPVEDALDADAETTQPGLSAAGDFGDVMPRPLPGVFPRAGLTELEYDREMRLTASVDIAGNRFELARDPLGRVERTEQPFDPDEGPIVQRYAFDHDGNVRLAQDGDQHVTEQEFDQFGRLERRRAPGAATGSIEETLYRYDRNGNVRSIQTPRGAAFTWQMSYDRLDRLVSQTNPRGDTTTWADFDGAGNPQEQVSPRGNVGGLSVAERQRFTTRRAYDALNRVVSITDGLGHLTTLDYDRNSNLVEILAPGSVAEPDGSIQPQVTTMTHDGRDLTYSVTTGTGTHERSTISEFDPNGNLRRRITPQGVTHVDGRPVPASSDTGAPRSADSETSKHATVFEYDADNLLRAVHQPWGDPVPGDAWSGQNGRRYVQEFDRDLRGRITRVTPSHDPDDAYEAEQIGRRRTEYTHFQNGWIKTATDPDYENDGAATVKRLHYGYDRRGHQTGWRFERQEGSAEPVVARDVTRVFAPNGTLASREARRPGKAPRTYAYTYNANHSLVSISDGDPEGEDHSGTRVTQIAVNKAEQPVLVDQMWEDGRDSTFRYDANGNVVRRQTDGTAEAPSDPTDLEQPYTYTGADARTTVFTYDPLDRELTTAVCERAGSCAADDPDARVTRSDWYPSGLLELRRKEHNDVDETRFYFDDGRIARMKRTAPAGTQKDQVYEYDRNGNRTQDERGGYLYNARDALIRWTRKSGSRLSYDLLGSRAIRHTDDSDGPDVTYDYAGDRLERMVSTLGSLSSTSTFEYDALDAVRFMRHDAGTAEYRYDEFERLRTAKGFGIPQGQEGDRYCYDALDRRALRIESSNATGTCATAAPGSPGIREYTYIGLTNQLSREHTTSGRPRTYDYDSVYNRLGRTNVSDGSYRSYAHDANGTVEGIEHEDGTLPEGELYPYDPYGRLEPSTRLPSDSPSKAEDELPTEELKDNPFRFQGFYYDTGTQTYDMYARDYRPDIARFLSQDRYADAYRDLSLLADPTSQNRYAFAGGDPVGHVEIDGHQDFHAIDTGQRGCFSCRGEGKVDRAAQAVNNIAGAAKRHTAENRELRVNVLQNNVAQALQQGDERRAAANLADLFAMQQTQLNAQAAQFARELATAESQAPDKPGFWDWAKVVFDPTDPTDWLATGASFTGVGTVVGGAAKTAKTAKKLNKVRKIAGAATSAARKIDRLSSVAGAATRRAAANFRTTMQLRQCAANSFVAGTPILMADGTRKPIEAVRVGDMVVATDPTTGATVARSVTALIRGAGMKELAVVWAGGERLTVTDNHPFYVVGRGWVEASELRRGDRLFTPEGELMPVQAVLDAHRPVRVYNLTVDGLHTYHAGTASVLVHNARCNLDGIVYLRRELKSGEEYVGRTNSPTLFRRRQSAHRRANPGSAFDYDVLGRAAPGRDLRVLEESWIRAGGGPGRLANKRYEMNEFDYRNAGGYVDP